MTAIDIASDFVKKHEGCRLFAYQDLAGIWTIGYGHTGPEVHDGLVWTQDQANGVLMVDLRATYVALEEHFTVAPTDYQLAALTSLAFNVGRTAVINSTLMRQFNAGDTLGAARQFPLWDHAGGTEIKGLLIRRFQEALLFLGIGVNS